MRASTTYNGGGSKITKIAIVTALHLGVAVALINMKVLQPVAPPFVPKPITPKKTVITPPKPDKLDTTTKKLEPPIFVPKPEVVTIEKPKAETPIAKELPPGPPPETDKGAGGKVGGTGTQTGTALTKGKGFTPIANNCARPDYPASAARNGETGTVNLALLIAANGTVADAKVEQSSGSRVLDRAAIAALSICQFKPATNNGVAEPAWGKIAYVWSLD